MLLNKGLILVPLAILSLTTFNNTIYAANSISGTKDRIKVVKFVEEINIDKLIRNEEDKKITYTRNSNTTSRSAVDRENKKE